jgi:ABC-type amino acid transport substrate-binding protein
MLFLISWAFAAPIYVGVEDSYPYSYQLNGEWTGVSVDLFEEIAQGNNWEIEYVIVPLANRMDAISTGTVDVYLPAVTVTAEREEKYDFSYTYFKDYLAVTTHEQNSFGTYIWNFLTKSLGALSIMIPVLCSVAFIYYWFEKRSSFLTWKEEAREYFDSIYWAMTTAATVGYGDESAKTIPGRITSMMWMVFGIMFFSWIITQINSSEIQTSIDPKSLPQNLVAVSGTTAADYLATTNLTYSTVETEVQLVEAYRNGAEIFHDQSLIHALLPNAKTLRIEEAPQYYGFLFPEDSPYIENTNRELLRTLQSSKWNGIRFTHLKE